MTKPDPMCTQGVVKCLRIFRPVKVTRLIKGKKTLPETLSFIMDFGLRT